jgi:hypothetical protein
MRGRPSGPQIVFTSAVIEAPLSTERDSAESPRFAELLTPPPREEILIADVTEY